MFGINTGVSGSIYRTSNNMRLAEISLNKSLERIETGNRINRASDDSAGFSKALTLGSDIKEAQAKKISNETTIAELKQLDTAQTSIAESLQQMRDAAVSYRDSVGDANAQASALTTINQLVLSINSLADNTELGATTGVISGSAGAQTITWGTETGETLSYTSIDLSTDATAADLDTDIAALDGTAATAATLIGHIDNALGEAMKASSGVGVTLDALETKAQTLLSDKVANLTDQYNSIMAIDEAVESSTVTNLQLRQEAMVSSIGIQNTFAASTLNLLA